MRLNPSKSRMMYFFWILCKMTCTCILMQYFQILQESCTLELHQSLGQDFKTIGACQLVFKDIFDKPHGRIHGTASLTGDAWFTFCLEKKYNICLCIYSKKNHQYYSDIMICFFGSWHNKHADTLYMPI